MTAAGWRRQGWLFRKVKLPKVTRIYLLVQGSAGIFCQGPDKDFRLLGRIVSVAVIQLCHCSMKAAIDNTQVNKCGCVPVKLYLWAQTFECSCVTQYCYTFNLFHLFKNIKAILSLRTIQKQVVGGIRLPALTCGPLSILVNELGDFLSKGGCHGEHIA